MPMIPLGPRPFQMIQTFNGFPRYTAVEIRGVPYMFLLEQGPGT